MSKTNNANRPAMPFQEVTGMAGGVPTGYKNHIGLTKREQFAMAALQGILSQMSLYPKDAAETAVRHADALLAELEK